MSTHPALVENDEIPERKPAPGSLEARVAARRRELESRTSDKFDVPGFEGVFQVELQVVGGKRQFALGQKAERIHDDYQRALRIAADCLLAATVGFHSVDVEGETQPAEDCTWKKLAKAFDPNLDVDAMPARVSLIRLIGEEGVFDLADSWKKWMRTRGVEVEKALEDFS